MDLRHLFLQGLALNIDKDCVIRSEFSEMFPKAEARSKVLDFLLNALYGGTAVCG